MLNLEKINSSSYKNSKNFVNSERLSTDKILLNLQSLFLSGLQYVPFEDRLIFIKTDFSSQLSKVSSLK